MDAVTGASSYTGRYIARELLARGRMVRSLARHHDQRLFSAPIDWQPLDFGNRTRLVECLSGVDTLYNTYWIRFPHAGQQFAGVITNTSMLVDAARVAGVQRFVHISVSNAPASALPYFHGKAATEEIVSQSGISYAIVRPTLVFGAEDILIHNMAWLLRHVPVYLIPGDGAYRVQPVDVADVARIAVDAAEGPESVVMDAAGPDILTYGNLVRSIRSALRSHSHLVHVPTPFVVTAARLLAPIVQDVLVTSDELQGLMDELLVSHEMPRGTTRFTEWLTANAGELGTEYISELRRHWRYPAP